MKKSIRDAVIYIFDVLGIGYVMGDVQFNESALSYTKDFVDLDIPVQLNFLKKKMSLI